MLKRYAGRSPEQRMRCAIASYNAGPGAVDKYGDVPPYRQTTAYVAHELRLRLLYAAAMRLSPRLFAREIIAGRPLLPAVVRIADIAPRRSASTAFARLHSLRARQDCVVSAKWTPRDSPYLHALDPNAYETLAPRTSRG